MKLIEHARIIICDSNSSIPFETLYFDDKKFVFVYETSHDYDEQDDRGRFFHKFQTVEQLKELIDKYYQQELDCRTEDSHEFFLEKYNEPDGTEIEQLATVREWLTDDREEISFDKNEIKQTIQDEFQSSLSPMVLYTLGDHTMTEIVQLYFSDENRVFDSMQENANEL